MKEKTIFTKKEWKEIEEMQARAKAKQQAQVKATKKKVKRNKIKSTIKNAIVILTSYAIITAILFMACNYIQSL